MSAPSPYIDELSGVYNRSYLKVTQEQEIKQLIQKQIPFSVVMVDIDHFKDINDVHGHIKGDEVIRGFAQFLKQELRTGDTVIRYGGDEFMCIMPGTTRQDVESIYERIIRRCKDRTFSSLTITLSAGIAARPDDALHFEQLLKIADDALYDAKRSGRARIGTVRKKRVEIPMRAFINRLQEKQQLRALLFGTEPCTRVMIVKGAVGIGKTRLVREVLGDTRGKEIIWSDCLAFAENIAYYPIREAIKYRMYRSGKEMIQDIPMVYRLELAKLVPEIEENIPEKPRDIEAMADRYRLYESVKRVFEVGAREKVVVIDNIQWIDLESLEVIKFLLRSFNEGQFICVFIYRTEEITGYVEDFLTYISREVQITDIGLNAFAHAHIKDSIKAIIGEEPSLDFTQYITRESGGIPFYIEEIVRALLDQSYLVVEEDQWVFKEPESKVVPRTLEDIMLRKHRSLSKEAQGILSIASVIGWFDIEIIRALTGYNEGEIFGLLADIQRLALAKYTKNMYTFAQEISRNAIYESFVKEPQKKILHRDVAGRIEERYRGRETEVIDELAFHYYKAGVRDKGATFCVQAGDRSREKYANRTAIRYYTWVLELLRGAEEEQNVLMYIDTLQKRANVCMLMGQYDRAMQDLGASKEQAQRIGDRQREAAAESMVGYVYFRTGRFDEAIHAAMRCKKIAEEIGDKDRIAEALNGIGNAHSIAGRHKEAKDYYESALHLFQELGNKVGELNARNNLGNVYEGLGDYTRALACFREAVQIAHDIKYAVHLGGYYSNIGWVHQLLGEFDTARRYYSDALESARKTGDTLVEARSYSDLGALYADIGDYEKALDFHTKALRIARKIGTRDSEAIYMSNIGAVYSAMGKYRTALSYFEDGLKIDQETKQESSTANAHYNIARVYAALGDFVKALKFYGDALETLRRLGHKRLESVTLHGIGNVYYHLGDFDKAMEHYGKAASIIVQTHERRNEFENLVSFARLFVALGKYNDAQQKIEAAYRIGQELHSNQMLLTTALLKNELLLEMNRLAEFKNRMATIDRLKGQVISATYQASVQHLYGRYYTAAGDFTKADACLKKALQLFKDCEEKMSIGIVEYHRAILEHARGDMAACCQCCARALQAFKELDVTVWQEKVEQFMNRCALQK